MLYLHNFDRRKSQSIASVTSFIAFKEKNFKVMSLWTSAAKYAGKKLSLFNT